MERASDTPLPVDIGRPIGAEHPVDAEPDDAGNGCVTGPVFTPDTRKTSATAAGLAGGSFWRR